MSIREQRRGRSIAMTPAERDAFLCEQRTCRMASLGSQGPHVAPLWFGWDGSALWVHSIVKSQRWRDVIADPRVAVVVDTAEEYFELRGVEIRGTIAPVGENPRIGTPDPQLEEIESIYSVKYRNGGSMTYDGRHAWLRLTPTKITSWDFRKLPRPR